MRVGNVDDPAPEIFVGQVLFPIAEILVVEGGKFRRHPRLGMNAVGDAGDRHLVRGTPVQTSFHRRAADFAVQFADAVGMPAHAQGQDRHAERIGGVDPGLAEGEKFVERHAEFGGETRRNICASFRAGTNRCPPGTGVWVVKTLADAATCRAA